ncbi:hypothetical protein RB653_007394 [Dictyostelium firmibasis]|uniref:Coiled-coil domain-containing protein 86 n=1 Tax=Dictyostelium firmibasis TaxID=79012 RepID=A0AAN7TVB8_9MYCE
MTGTRRTSSIADTQFMSLLKSSSLKKPRKSIKPENDTKVDGIDMDTDLIQEEKEQPKKIENPIVEKPVKKVGKKVAAKKPENDTKVNENDIIQVEKEQPKQVEKPVKKASKKVAAKKPENDTKVDDIGMDTNIIQEVKKVDKKIPAKKASTKKAKTPIVIESETAEKEQSEEPDVVITEKPVETVPEDEDSVIITKDSPAPTPKPSKEEDVPKAKEEKIAPNTTTTTTKQTPTVNKMKRTIQEIDPTRGKPVSGRVWKTPSSKLNSAIKSKGFKQSFENKQKQRVDMKRMKEKEREIKEKTKLDKTNMHNAIRENKRIKEENLKKSEVVQVINNTNKLKKLSKKDWKLYRKN